MWATRLLLIIPQLFLVPFLIGTIGESGYGVYALVWSLVLSIEQLQSSLQQGVVKYTAACLAYNMIDEVNKFVSSSFIYSLFIAVLAFITIFTSTIVSNSISGNIGTAMLVVGFLVMFIIPLTPYIAVIQSLQRFYVDSLADTCAKYLSLLVIVIWFHVVGPSIAALIIIMSCALFFARLVQVPVAYRAIPGLRNHPSLFDWKNLKLIASFGGAVVLLGLCLMMNTTGIRWLMSVLVSTSFVAHLSIMLLPASLLSQIILAVTLTVMPATSAYAAKGNQFILQELLIRGMRYTFILTLAGVFVAVLMMENVLDIWLGHNYVFLAPYAIALFLSMSFLLSTSVAHHMLKGLGKLRTIVFISLVGSVIIPIVVILVYYSVVLNPYVSVTVGLAVGNIVCGLMQLFFGSKAVDANLRDIFKRVYVQPILGTTIVWLPISALIFVYKIDSLMGRACLSTIAILLFSLFHYKITANTEEKALLKDFVLIVVAKYKRKQKFSECS